MSHSWIQVLGWIATAVFVASYFFRRPSFLRGAQMVGAALWITYGCLIGASPVIVANAMVFAAAAWTILRESRPSTNGRGGDSEARGVDVSATQVGSKNPA